MVKVMGDFYDSQDPCQFKNNPDGKLPSYCGSSNTRAWVYDSRGNRVGYSYQDTGARTRVIIE